MVLSWSLLFGVKWTWVRHRIVSVSTTILYGSGVISAAWPLCAGSTSAKQIIACSANSNKILKSRIQQQMVDEEKSIQDTDASRVLYDQWASEGDVKSKYRWKGAHTPEGHRRMPRVEKEKITRGYQPFVGWKGGERVWWGIWGHWSKHWNLRKSRNVETVILLDWSGVDLTPKSIRQKAGGAPGFQCSSRLNIYYK